MTIDPNRSNQVVPKMDKSAAFDSFGKHPVLRNESKQLYLSLRDTAIVQVDPRDLFEVWHLRCSVDCIFEALRYERCSTALIAITERAAFTRVAEDFDLPAKANKMLSELVAGWFQDNTVRNWVVSALAPFGFDEGVVNAIAMSMQSSQLSRWSEMRARAEAQATAHLREIERRREAAAKILEYARPDGGPAPSP
jgi:hypothetical protein